ncbi:hypothetical protein [Spirochaeta lutea]|uniref:hypothetical protein n=1 Tax=Spirochaeta lutea TaxID=1480694 RepID=UPI000B1275BA|nr:hypothetical protein [Spirochaeta lutea]
MTHLKKAILLVLLWSGVMLGAYPQEANQVRFSISFFNQEIYYPDSAIQVKVSILNNSPGVYRFRLADDRKFNLDFTIVDLKNTPLPTSPEFTTARTSNQRIYFREVSLNPGEEFSFTSTLNDYRMVKPGIYVVQGLFYPELVGNAGSRTLSSNRLTLSVRPEYTQEERTVFRVEEEQRQLLQEAALPPDEVVAYMLDARMHSRKAQFFLYVDLEQLYRMDPRRDSQFRRLSEAEQHQILQQYEETLWEPENDDSIRRIPLSYEIRRTSYDATTAQVDVIQRYQMDSYIEIKRYIYTLQRRDGIWYITGYTVSNLGTE